MLFLKFFFCDYPCGWERVPFLSWKVFTTPLKKKCHTSHIDFVADFLPADFYIHQVQNTPNQKRQTKADQSNT